jgi:6,7-dimethyl-8-ribityllumazine synthase
MVLGGLSESSVKIDGSGMKIAIIHTRWNSAIINELVIGAEQTLIDHGVSENDITVKTVPGAFELPYATRILLEDGEFDAV